MGKPEASPGPRSRAGARSGKAFTSPPGLFIGPRRIRVRPVLRRGLKADTTRNRPESRLSLNPLSLSPGHAASACRAFTAPFGPTRTCAENRPTKAEALGGRAVLGSGFYAVSFVLVGAPYETTFTVTCLLTLMQLALLFTPPVLAYVFGGDDGAA